MPMPTLTPAAQRLYEREVAPLAEAYDAEHDYALAHLCQFFASLVDTQYRLAFAAEVPWAVALDAETAAGGELAWLGQFNGVVVPPNVPVEVARERVRIGAGQRRGTVTAMREAMIATLDDPETGVVTIYERAGGAYRLLVVSYDAQTTDAAATEAAAVSQKPAGIVMTYRTDPGWSIGQFEVAYDGQTFADVPPDFTDMADLETELPA